LELGIDVGDLDRVIQIDCPPTVSSFLQRMGRTGRRSGTLRNCLFLATKDESLVQAAGLMDLWDEGYVEPVSPPPEPYHILAQQLMALALQQRGIGRKEWFRWIEGVRGFAAIPSAHVERLVDWMLEKGILWSDEDLLWLGRQGEEAYGRKNFLELFSVFTSPPLFGVLHGRRELGYVDEMTFLSKQEGPRVLLLGARAWHVKHVDWQRRLAYVEETEAPGRSRWMGTGQGLGFRLSQAVKRALASDHGSARWSQRAERQIDEVRKNFSWLQYDSTVVLRVDDEKVEWWTFAGMRANATLARQLAQATKGKVHHDSFTLTFDAATNLDDTERAIDDIRKQDAAEMRPAVDEAALDGLKFSECLPVEMAIQMLERRLADPDATRRILEQEMQSLTSKNALQYRQG
jgi:ATP-dependent Lhr-like helicase